jgi:hypothetical protein
MVPTQFNSRLGFNPGLTRTIIFGGFSIKHMGIQLTNDVWSMILWGCIQHIGDYHNPWTGKSILNGPVFEGTTFRVLNTAELWYVHALFVWRDSGCSPSVGGLRENMKTIPFHLDIYGYEVRKICQGVWKWGRVESNRIWVCLKTGYPKILDNNHFSDSNSCLGCISNFQTDPYAEKWAWAQEESKNSKTCIFLSVSVGNPF